MLRWRNSAPLGKPVVPVVYWSCAGSSGRPQGARRRRRRRRTARRWWRGGTQSQVGQVVPERVDNVAQRCATELVVVQHHATAALAQHELGLGGVERGVTVTSMTPASPAPNSRSTHSGELAAQMAMRPPGGTDAATPRATSVASCRSCGSVHRRRSAAATPSTRRVCRSGVADAASVSSCPTVVSSTSPEGSAGRYDTSSATIGGPPAQTRKARVNSGRSLSTSSTFLRAIPKRRRPGEAGTRLRPPQMVIPRSRDS